MPALRHPLAAAVAMAATCPVALALPAITGPPNARLTAPAPAPLAAVTNGDLRQGLAGWDWLGAEPPTVAPGANGAPVLTLRHDITAITPPFSVPADAQAVQIRANAPGAGAVLQVDALPVDGAPGRELAELDLGSALRTVQLPIAPFAGRDVRLRLDPTTAFGRVVQILGIGPLMDPVPGFTVLRGAPSVRDGRPRGVLVADDGPVEVASSPFARGPGARAVLVALRGSGTVRLRVGRATLTAAATARWRDISVPLPAAAATRPLTVRVALTPTDGPVSVSDVGLVVRATRMTGLTRRLVGSRVVIRGRIGPAGGRLPVVVRIHGGRRLASGRTRLDGRFRLSLPSLPARAWVATPGDRTRLPGVWPLR